MQQYNVSYSFSGCAERGIMNILFTLMLLDIALLIFFVYHGLKAYMYAVAKVYYEMILRDVMAAGMTVCDLQDEQHKKTRKETQEIKTRLAQVRKDLNKIQSYLESVHLTKIEISHVTKARKS